MASAAMDGKADGEAAKRAGRPRRGLGAFARWAWSWAVPGLGMFNEAYYIFSVGNLKPIWTEQFPDCWKRYAGCSSTLLHSLAYSQVAGLIAGMLTVGLAIDGLGRRAGSIITASIMFVAGALLTGAAGPTAGATFLFIVVAQALFGFGVGGEFPVAASSASELAEASPALRAKRGEITVLTFAMQAWGTILNLVVLLVFLAALGQTGPPYDATALSITWRMQYGLGLLPIVFMLAYRCFYLKESAVWQAHRQQRRTERELAAADQEERKARAACAGVSRGSTLRLLGRHYWHRLAGTALGWFAWDFYYYGNKLFQSEFIDIIHPGATLLGQLEYNLLNSSVALFGYYVAAFTIDKPWMGRRRMQVIGFAAVFILFLAGGLSLGRLTASPQGLQGLQALYYLSSFWAQFVNASTFLLASECFPTAARGVAHGLSAAVGKLGALAADIIFNGVDDRSKWLLSSGAGAVGVLVTFLFVPELTGLDLAEGDAWWRARAAGTPGAYKGPAASRKHLSLFEFLFCSCGECTGGGGQGPHSGELVAPGGPAEGVKEGEPASRQAGGDSSLHQNGGLGHVNGHGREHGGGLSGEGPESELARRT